MNKRTCHFSIDDVTLADDHVFQHLVTWHEVFDLKVTLYCYTSKVSEVSNTTFFCDNSKWLKLGFHSYDERSFLQDAEYRRSFRKAQSAFRRIDSGQTDTLRLHCWECSKEQEQFLSRNGIHEILVKDKESRPSALLNHRITEVRFETLDKITPESLYIGNPHVVCFTHEWCFRENVHKIEDALRMYRENGYLFCARGNE